jgi:hypothetical protein
VSEEQTDTQINVDMGAGRQRTVPVTLPPNSYASKKTPQPETTVEAPRVKRDKLVEGTVTMRKKSVPTRMFHTLFSGQTDSVSTYVVGEVLLPAAKNMLADTVGMIADAFRQGMEQAIFGDTRPSRTGSRPGYTNYSNVKSSGVSTARQAYGERKFTAQQRANHDFSDAIFQNRGEAEDVLEKLQILIEQFKVATVADLYDYLGVTNEFVDNTWGWTDLRGASVVMVRGGHLLRLPKPIPID